MNIATGPSEIAEFRTLTREREQRARTVAGVGKVQCANCWRILILKVLFPP